MPMLANERHELFAQGLARGVSASEAYRAAGYDVAPDIAKANAYRLGKKAHLGARVAELLAERARIADVATQKAADALAIDREWIMARLKTSAETALRALDGPDGFCGAAGSVANRALELLGKEIGMFIEKTENKTVIHKISAKPMNKQEWRDKYTTEH